MRIAMLGPFGLHPNKTMRSRAMKLGAALVAQGHSVKVIMPPWQTPNEADKQWSEDGMTLEYVAVQGGILPIVRRMLDATDNFKPDVVYGFKPKAYSGLCMWWLWQRRWMRQGPILVTDTDDWEGWGGWNDLADYSTTQKYFFAWQEKWGMTHCDFLTVASRELDRRAKAMGISQNQRLNLPNGSGITIDPKPNPVEVAKRRGDIGLADRPTLLLYSRLFEFDTSRLIDILQRVQAKIPDLAILMIGAGLFADQAAAFRKQLEAADLLKSCFDVGWLAEEGLPATILAGHVGLYLMDDTLLNRTKCPVKLADMIGLGIPVVGEAVGQVCEYIHDGVNGRLCDSGDVAGLAERLVDLLSGPADVRERLGQAGIQHYQELFAWEKQAARLIETLTE